MDSSLKDPARRCPTCGAEVSENATSCWLCFSPLTGQQISPVNIKPVATAPEARSSFSLSSLMMLVTLVCVVLGLFTIARGFGVILGFIAFVAWLRTAVKVHNRSANNEVLTTADKLVLFFRSFAATFLIVGLVLVACVATLFVACVAMLGNMH